MNVLVMLLGSLMQGVGAHTFIQFRLATVIAGAVVIFVMAFLLGLWCGWMWRQRWRRGPSQVAIDLKRRARS